MVVHCIHELFIPKFQNHEGKHLKRTVEVTCYSRLYALGVNVHAIKDCAFTDEELLELTDGLESLVNSSKAST